MISAVDVTLNLARIITLYLENNWEFLDYSWGKINRDRDIRYKTCGDR